MVEVKQYYLQPTKMIPNSPLPVLHYPDFLSKHAGESTSLASKVSQLFTDNSWQVQWLVRYGATQKSHYHSGIHECMAVLSGSATIRFGVADTNEDFEQNTHGPAKEDGGIELQARAGDVFVIPAGVAHKTYDTLPSMDFKRITSGDGHEDVTKEMEKLSDEKDLDGFTMLGAYPVGHGTWDFAVGGENEGTYSKVWAIEKPRLDPVLGKSVNGLCGLWH